MNFLLDQNMPVALAKWLVARGHVAEHVKRLQLQEADDLAVMRHALRTGAIIITKDNDFRQLAVSPPRGLQVVLVRFGNTTNPELLQIWEPIWPAIEQALLAGEHLVEVA